MIEVKTRSGKILRMYESCKEISAERMNEVHKYSMVDTGVGSTFQEVWSHFAMQDKFLNAGDLDGAKKENHNLMMNLNFMIEKIDTKSLSFACLIHSADRVVITDFSQDALIDLSKKVNKWGIPYSRVKFIVEDLKKNLRPN